ncbi:MAG TPA: hypothetical protein VMN60_13000 [Longimicrobiales bacterium]|nr:hypothetical protein [Longimicrobiales bacterium]
MNMLQRCTVKCAMVSLVLAVTAGSRAEAQTIEARYTRVFGADSLQLTEPAMSLDGRWIVVADLADNNLRLISTRTGNIVRLTTGDYNDHHPTWHPDSERIYFVSSRGARGDGAFRNVMSIRIDRETGRVLEAPRQITLEHCYQPAVSPDGRMVACVFNNRLLVVPSTGGTTRELATFAGMIWQPTWSADSRDVYGLLSKPGRSKTTVVRVAIADGRGSEVLEASRNIVALSPGARFLFHRYEQQGQRVVEVMTLDGRSVGRFTPRSRETDIMAFTADGNGMIGLVHDVAAPVRVLPVAGGPMRQVTEAVSTDEPVGWSEDGRTVLVHTRVNGYSAILRAPLSGGPATELRLPEGALLFDHSPNGKRMPLSADGRYSVLTYPGSSPRDGKRLVVYRLSDGQQREVSRALFTPQGYPVLGPGGGVMDGADFLFLERYADRIELKRVAPEGQPRTMRTFPLSMQGTTSFAVHGTRVVYLQTTNDTTDVMLVDGLTGAPRRLTRIPAREVATPVWSPDGSQLVLEYGVGPFKLVVLEIGASGVTNTRIIETPAQIGFAVQWLPDGSGVTFFSMNVVNPDSDVWLVPLTGSAQATSLTRDEPGIGWFYLLSPDGRHLAYTVEVPRGGSVWLVDLGNALARVPAPDARNPRR